MLPYKPLLFDQEFLNNLRSHVLGIVGTNTQETTIIPTFGPEIDQKINQQLYNNHLPAMRSCMIFKRMDRRSADYKFAHIDGNGVDFTHCSVVVPIDGCNNTALCWFDGIYP